MTFKIFDYFISCVQTNSYLVSSVYDHTSITNYNISCMFERLNFAFSYYNLLIKDLYYQYNKELRKKKKKKKGKQFVGVGWFEFQFPQFCLDLCNLCSLSELIRQVGKGSLVDKKKYFGERIYGFFFFFKKKII